MRATIFVAFLYAFTVLAPHAAVALVGSHGLLHCFTQKKIAHEHAEASVQSPHAHSHAAAGDHEHADNPAGGEEQKGPTAACCGLFTAVALPSDLRIVVPMSVESSALVAQPLAAHDGQIPARLIRPPIA